MPSWNEVLNELTAAQRDPHHEVLTKYLAKLHEKRGRNVIAYYSGWLQKEGEDASLALIDLDMNSFMAVVHGMEDFGKGLDLILHTPGGVVEATESIGIYLRNIFKTDIEVFIPQIAMSAGTMLACIAKTIYMGKQSSIGPIDPQLFHPRIGTVVSAGFLIDEFKKATKEIEENPTQLLVWSKILEQYPPAFLLECENALARAEEFVASWLAAGMVAEQEEKKEGASSEEEALRKEKAAGIAADLANYRKEKSHSRHIGIAKARDFGLNVAALEDNDPEWDYDLQDLVLTIHHAFMHTFAHTNRTKIVANHADGVMSYIAPPQPPQSQG